MDILDEIIERRKADIARLGYEYGCDVPKKRGICVRKFLAERGAILEVKRASPSKGDISPDLDAAKTALEYAKNGARAISVLTEKNYFKGSLDDLIAVRAALDEYAAQTGNDAPAVLRKDFLCEVQDVDVAYRAGADVVLLIARILTKEQFFDMAEKVCELGMSALIE
ncbi:MAG: bifunctional indole-3-glycerol phosphate synthase/phosphoribosylanthranilate isomerase, partial [Treponemataceae bacterium]|nr:bifunctional indole-3-glycerol phosphate synthase/phosphoribosylanthranilate isomerase [Treponemataceae bacterium]